MLAGTWLALVSTWRLELYPGAAVVCARACNYRTIHVCEGAVYPERAGGARAQSSGCDGWGVVQGSVRGLQSFVDVVPMMNPAIAGKSTTSSSKRSTTTGLGIAWRRMIGSARDASLPDLIVVPGGVHPRSISATSVASEQSGLVRSAPRVAGNKRWPPNESTCAWADDRPLGNEYSQLAGGPGPPSHAVIVRRLQFRPVSGPLPGTTACREGSIQARSS